MKVKGNYQTEPKSVHGGGGGKGETVLLTGRASPSI